MPEYVLVLLAPTGCFGRAFLSKNKSYIITTYKIKRKKKSTGRLSIKVSGAKRAVEETCFLCYIISVKEI